MHGLCVPVIFLDLRCESVTYSYCDLELFDECNFSGKMRTYKYLKYTEAFSLQLCYPNLPQLRSVPQGLGVTF